LDWTVQRTTKQDRAETSRPVFFMLIVWGLIVWGLIAWELIAWLYTNLRANPASPGVKPC